VITLANLKPETTYQWQLNNGEHGTIITPQTTSESESDVLYRFGVGGLGGALDPDPEYFSPASLWDAFQQFGFLDVTIGLEAANLVFRNPQGDEMKSFNLKKNQ